MKKYIRLYIRLVRISWLRMTQYRTNFTLLSLAKLIRLLFLFVFFDIVYTRVDSIAGYTKYELLLFVSTFSLVELISSTFFLRNLFDIRWQIRAGTFDHTLLKPVNPLFSLSLRELDFMDLLNIFPMTCLLIYALSRSGLHAQAPAIALYIAMMFLALLIVYSLDLALCSFSFWIVETWGLESLLARLLEFGRLPSEIYQKNIGFLFAYALPVFLISTWPVKALMDRLDWYMILLAVLVSIASFIAALKLWDFNLKKYVGVGS